MRTLNLGILAHVDAGKTSLTERLLFAAGVTTKLGSVDAGNTQTDTLELERQRGITIRSAVVSFAIGGTNINLIDTPRSPRFSSPKSSVRWVFWMPRWVVVSAVEGGAGADARAGAGPAKAGRSFRLFHQQDRSDGRALCQYDQGFARAIAGSPIGHVNRCRARQQGGHGHPRSTPAGEPVREALAENDEALLDDYLQAPERLTAQRISRALANQVGRGLLHPAYAGSAATGVGLSALMDAIETLLPAQEANPDGPVAGRIFKIERGWGGEKQAYLSLTSGTIALRDLLALPQGEARITGIKAFQAGKLVPANRLKAGQIGRVSGAGQCGHRRPHRGGCRA
jgi:ribosomal protection tetracycline resistance protein